jgi:hypothetical protein
MAEILLCAPPAGCQTEDEIRPNIPEILRSALFLYLSGKDVKSRYMCHASGSAWRGICPRGAVYTQPDLFLVQCSAVQCSAVQCSAVQCVWLEKRALA